MLKLILSISEELKCIIKVKLYMKFTRKLWIGSAVAALLSNGSFVLAQDAWQARQLNEVLEDIIIDEYNRITYTVQVGDTLSVIAEAMDIPLDDLAYINDIEDVDLIFPETILTAQLDAYDRVESLEVESPDGEILEFEIPVNLSPVTEVEEVQTEEVVEEAPLTEDVESTSYSIGGPTNTEADFNETIIEEVPVWVATETVAAEEVVTEEVVEEVAVVEETPIVEEVPVVEETPGVEEVPVVEETPVYEEVVEEVAVEEPVYETDLTVEEGSQSWEIVEEVPAYEDAETEMPEEVYEDVYEEVVTEEDIVVEEPVYEEEVAYDPMSNPQNAGLQPHAAEFKEEVAAIYGIDSFSLYRPGDSQDHGAGLAVDFMVPVGSQSGDDVANYSISNMAENNISYVIWEQQIYGSWNNQWEWMEDRGSVTANHYDHVHVSFNP